MTFARARGEGERGSLADLDALALVLDAKFRLPGGFRIGWDAIVGMVPVLGDGVTSLVSGYIVIRAAALGAPASVLARMLLNIGIDAVVTAIPLVGWIADTAWKANLRNVALLRASLRDPARTRRASRFTLAAAALGVSVLAAALTATAFALALALVRIVAHLAGIAFGV